MDETDIPEEAKPPMNVKIPEIDKDYQRILASSQMPMPDPPEDLIRQGN